jgi:hypothetical protein
MSDRHIQHNAAILKLLLHQIATFCLDFRHMGCLPDK